MILHHTTTRKNASAILASALLCRKARGKLKAVWMHTRSRSVWAIRHVAIRRGCSVEEIVRLELDVPRSWLRRFGRGVWYCMRDIPADRVRVVSTFLSVEEVVCPPGRPARKVR